MGIVEAIILAIVEGLTEFLPVSSTGHMIITSSLMGIAEDDFTKSFIVQIQFGTILSVVVLYFKRFFKSLEFYMRLFLAFIPAAILGFLFADMIDALLENVIVVAISLLVGGIFLLFVDRIFKANETAGKDRPDFMNSFVIGLFQVLAMIPGVSRSAATIVGGMTQKLNRKAATEFSFFLAVPTMFAATGYKLYKSFDEGPGFTGEEVGLLALGNVIGFIVALFAIRFFIGFVTKNGFKIFGIYRILLGLIIIALSLAGYNLSIV